MRTVTIRYAQVGVTVHGHTCFRENCVLSVFFPSSTEIFTREGRNIPPCLSMGGIFQGTEPMDMGSEFTASLSEHK